MKLSTLASAFWDLFSGQIASNHHRSPVVSFSLYFALALLVFRSSAAAAPLLKHDFGEGADDNIGPGFQQVTNGQGGGSADPSTGKITTGASGTSTYGLNTRSPLNGKLAGPLQGIEISWVITSASIGDLGSITANGWFFGFTSNSSATGMAATSLWNQKPDAMGIVLESDVYQDRSFIQMRGMVDEFVETSLGAKTATIASVEDGFTVTLRITPHTWKATSTGLSQDFQATGRLAPVVKFADFQNDLVPFTSIQGKSLSFDLGEVSVSTFDLPDRDGDKMPDEWETAHGLNPDEPGDAKSDSDAEGGADGLTNLDEFLAGTHPNKADTDGDGLKDGDEISGSKNPWNDGALGAAPGAPTDPLSEDSDGDTITDADEIAAGTDPNSFNTLPDLKVTFVDSDGDSYRDEAEIAFGTDPEDRQDHPTFATKPNKPNIVIIYLDDLGYNDISRYGKLYGGIPGAVETPRMDQLADQGVTFLHGHSSNGICTPSRYALLTGKYNWREFNGITNHYGGIIGGDEVPRPNDVTIAEFLKGQGYTTAAFGKWHLGGHFYTPDGGRVKGNPEDPAAVDWARPVRLHAVDHGFDHFRGLAATINRGPYVYMHNDRIQIWDPALNDGYGDVLDAATADGGGGFRDATADDTLTWLTGQYLSSTINTPQTASTPSLGDPTYSQTDAELVMLADLETYLADRAEATDAAPFFAYIPFYSPHLPSATTEPYLREESARGNYYTDWIREVDDRVGRILDAIDTNKLDQNTIVFFTADNGAENIAMRQGKEFGYDPSGPLRGNKRSIYEGGTRVPFVVRWPGQAAAGTVVDDIVWQGDFFATLAAYLGEEIPDTTCPDGESFLNLIRGQKKPPGRTGIMISGGSGQKALKTNDGWKFINQSGDQLYYLPGDVAEDKNLIAGKEPVPETQAVAGRDLHAEYQALATTTTAKLFDRRPDNDGDGIVNAEEQPGRLEQRDER